MKLIEEMIQGKYKFEKMEAKNNSLTKMGMNKVTVSMARQEQLLKANKRTQADQTLLSDVHLSKDTDNKDYSACAPMTDGDFKELFWDWFQMFHKEYLGVDICGQIGPARVLFHVNHNGFAKYINPDIEGNITRSIIDSSKVLKLSQP